MLSRNRWARWAMMGVLAPSILLLLVGPVLAHDPISGAPAVTISAGATLDDRDVTVRVGDIVRFVNADGERHRFRSTSGPGRFDTGNLEPGEAASIRVMATGTYHYRDERNRDSAGYQGIIRARPAAASTPPASGPDTAIPRQATVTIGDRVFLPGTTTVAVGGTVTFENADRDEHTATSAGGGPIDSGTLGSGGTYQVTISTPGTYGYICAIHPDMTATIEVVEAEATSSGPAATASADDATAAVSGDASPPSPVPLDAGSRPASTATGAATNLDATVQIVAGVLLVSISMILFARLMRGTIRATDRP